MSLENRRNGHHRSEKASKKPESFQLLIPAHFNLSEMRTQFIDAGFNLKLTDSERQSLEHPQFRDLDSGRGVGVVAVLGRVKTQDLLDWCQKNSPDGPRVRINDKVIPGSEGRGLMQLSADFLLLLTTPDPQLKDLDRFCLRTNQRIIKGLIWEIRIDEIGKENIRQKYNNIPEPKPTLTPIPPGTLSKLWDFLTKK